MRAAAILGLGCSPKNLAPFQSEAGVEWHMGMPASATEADVVLIFGGDGTIHRHLGQLVKLARPVLVVPMGSGNDFARALGLTRVRDSLTAWRKFCCGAGNKRAIDLGVISSAENGAGAARSPEALETSTATARYFCCVAGLGLDAEVQRRANRLPRWLRGNGGYALTLAPTIFTFDPLPMKVFTTNGETGDSAWPLRSAGPNLLAAFANTPYYGGGMRIAPHARMDDGLLDVCIVGEVGRFRLFRLAPTVYTGQHLEVPEVSYFQTKRIRVETEHPVDVYADGEYVCRTPIEVGIQPTTLKVVTG